MAKFRDALPQLGGGFFLTDGGIETTLMFREGVELPDFAAFHLLNTGQGDRALRRYFCSYAEMARRFGAGFILESATWRANPDWGTRLAYTKDQLAHVNERAIRLLEAVRGQYQSPHSPMVISGCVGPRGDGYVPDCVMSAEAAERYHRAQVDTFAACSADMVCAITMNYVGEALGIAHAARRAGMPVALSFTVETDGRLPTGQPLKEAIEHVDDEMSGYPSYYMINCAHPSHFEHLFEEGGYWLERIRGLRANASRKSHAELNESTQLDVGNPEELGAQYADLMERLPNLNVLGGCCGTDQRHVESIAQACAPLFRGRAGQAFPMAPDAPRQNHYGGIA